MNDNKRTALTDMYGGLAEELRIAYICLKCEGFTSDEAMDLLMALIFQSTRMDAYRGQTMSRARKMERLREYMNELDFTNHTGDDYEQ